MHSIVEIFVNGQWVRAAEFTSQGRYKATFEYLIDYVFSDNPSPVSLSFPVNTKRFGIDSETGAPECPAFLLDLVPQGRGRKLLTQELGVADSEDQDLSLVQHGAFNPIGNLRIDTAVAFYKDWEERNRNHRTDGFTFEDIITRKEEFLEHIWMHAMYAAGTTGVQGAAPKFLLTQNKEGLWFADAALPDAEATKHWLVKQPRGTHETDYTILRNGAAYLRVSARCGLRTGGKPMYEGDMLFVPRFDRAIEPNGLQRLHQETLASLCGMRGFGLTASLFSLVEGFRRHVTDPVAEIVEFIQRDILNLAMKNTDNHARNTSVQRLPDGTIQLTPIYDFAPMYLDREMILRGCRWSTPERRDIIDLSAIIDKLSLSGTDKQYVATRLHAFSGTIVNLPEIMDECGVDRGIIEHCIPSIDQQLQRLEGI